MRGEEPRSRFGALCATDALRLPFTRSSTGDVAEAGVVGDRNKLSLGLMFPLAGGVMVRGMLFDVCTFVVGKVLSICESIQVGGIGPASRRKSNDDR